MSNFEKRLPGEIPTLETRHESHEKVDKKKRYREILECLADKELTAKEIAVLMYQKGYIPTTERNFSSPRLCEMAQKGIVEPVGKKICSYTGKKVTVWALCEGAYGNMERCCRV